MFKKIIFMALAVITAAGILVGCKPNTSEPKDTDPVPVAEPVTLTIAGSWSDCVAIEAIGSKFIEKYPNCTIKYECLQNYYATLPKRMSGDDTVDLFFTTNIQNDGGESSTMIQYAVDLNDCEGLDLSNTFDGLIQNFLYRENPTPEKRKLYSIPLGAEMRGMYVNVSLLKSVGINEVPTNQTELFAVCKILKENGYIPFQGNPSQLGQWLIYPWICNQIANADNPAAAWTTINSRDGAGARTLLEEPLTFLYNLVSNYYYDYKTAQKDLNLFNGCTESDYVHHFLNIVADGDSFKIADNTAGKVAFMPAPISYQSLMKKTHDDYNSSIEYVFVPAPVGNDGGYVYLSPAHAIAANKNSVNKEWSIKFLNFLFQPENNELFAEKFNIMPNTKGAFDYISTLYNVPKNHISHLGQVTFDYNLFEALSSDKHSIVETAKANKPDTVAKNGGKMYDLNYYLDLLQSDITGTKGE